MWIASRQILNMSMQISNSEPERLSVGKYSNLRYARKAMGKNIDGRWPSFAFLIFLLTLFSQAGCTTVGPQKLVSSHESYNDAVQLTVSREVLKNIVRKRYSDPMQFIAVSTINAQFSVSSGVNVGASGIGTSSAAGQAGANIGFSDSPTITFVPQSDAGFNKSLDTPVNLQEALSYVFHTGRFQSYEIGLVIGAINDSPDRSGKRGERYRQKVRALQNLIEQGATLRNFREFYPRHEPISMEQVTGRAYVEAAKAGLYFYDAGGGKLYLASKHMGIALVVPSQADAAITADLALLELEPGEKMYPLRAPSAAEPELFGVQPNTIWLAPRSVESMIELAGMQVKIPEEHLQNGLVVEKSYGINTGVDLPLTIRSSKDQPLSPYRIQHRGYWFYIDDTDTVSKQIFTTIVDSYSSRIGSKGPGDEAPQIVLPISGG